jgi:hypothetical protein
MKKRSLILTLAALCLFAASAKADLSLNFYNITNNKSTDAKIGEDQLTVKVQELINNKVGFLFENSGPKASVISEIYFDDGALLKIANIFDGPGVKFEQIGSEVKPPNLPGWDSMTPQFQVTAGFLAEAESPEPTWGVGPQQWVNIIFDLQPNKSYADVVTALTLPTAGEWLRIGIHVKDFAGGGSESFVNVPVPVPGALLLGSLGLGYAGMKLRRRCA